MGKFYRILFLGDFHYGESYRQAGARVLQQHGYEYATRYLQTFIRSADYTVVNLETPIVGVAHRTSPLLGRKRYLHWADESQTPYHLRKLGVDAAALANNHIMDQGQDGLRETLRHLSSFGIEGFGAGKDRSAANAPLSIRLPNNVGGGVVNVYSSFQYSKRHDHEFEFYAKRTASGCAPLSSGTRYELCPGDVYNIAFPHWGANYKWKTNRQESLAEGLAAQGFNVTIGHGSHSLQEIDSVMGMPTIYGIGNGVFQSGGRFAQFEEQEHILPFGFWAMLEFSYQNEIREARLKLYPVLANNKESNYVPKPVTSDEHHLIYSMIKERSGDLSAFELNSGNDDLGLYLQLNLGKWGPPSKSLVTSDPAAEQDGGIKFLRHLPKRNRLDLINEREILRQQQELNRTIGTLITAAEASRDEYSITWIDRRTALATSKNDSRLIQGHRSTEGSVAAAVVKDKLLTKRLLSEAGVKTPDGQIVSSADEAIRVWRNFGRPVVLKPRFGNKGSGVFVNLDSEEAISKHYVEVAKLGEVLLEEYLGTGTEYRCLATPEETVSTVMRVLPWVEGDGVSTVRELIVEKNNSRFSSPSTHGRYIPIDSTVDRFLAQSRLSITSVLPAGVRIYVRDVGGLSSGGEPYEVSELVGEEITRLAARACSVIPGLTWCGADVLMTANKGAYIVEINTDADISGAVYPWYGTPKNVGSHIWSELKAKGGGNLSDDVCSGMGLRERSEILTSSAPFCDSSNSRISEFLLGYVRELGGVVERVSPMLSRVKLEDGATRWLRGCATEVDHAVPSSVLRSHLRVRKLLGVGRVLRVRGRQVRNSNDLPEFSLGEGPEHILVPARRQWEPTSAIHARSLEREDHEEILKRRFFMQEYPSGTRLRVAASPTEVFVIFGETQNVDVSSLKAGCRAAVNAVRCIPQLRFAFVDVVLRETNGGTRIALVEGVSSDPVVRSAEQVLYGDLESLWQFVLNTGS